MTRVSLFPPEVRLRQADPRTISGELYPAERALVAAACEARRREFRAGRLLAKGLLEEMGIFGFPILMGDRREPLWPAMVCGSITHLSDICLVAVVEKSKIFGIGLDVARTREVNANIWPTFLTEGELQWVRSLPPPVAQRCAAMMFSAKEALFKCLYPVVRMWIDFKDVRISTAAAYRQFRRGRFTHILEEDELLHGDTPFEAEFLVEKGDMIPRGFKISGVYRFDGPYVFTAMTMSRQHAPLPRMKMPETTRQEDMA